MREGKQSFLERLTGTHSVENEARVRTETRTTQRPVEEAEWETEPQKELYADNEYEESEDEEDEEPGLAIDIYESDNELVIQSMIAGITPENLHISITRNAVTISGRRNEPQGIPDEHYVTRELYWGSFSRVIDLPYEINTEGAEAIEKYGLLIIRLPKLDTERTAELKVKSI